MDLFVGREKEMAQLGEALDTAASGRGQITMLVGEPGIGKTRLSQEFATHATDRGAIVMSGRCYEGEGAPPYWPWISALRPYIAETTARKLRSEMGAGAADISEIMPEIGSKLSDLETPVPLPSAEARFRRQTMDERF